MKTELSGTLRLCDFAPATDNFREEFLLGLRSTPKTLPCKYFYDEQGSLLFDRICELEEYYPTRTEASILRDNISEIARCCGPHCLLVELGSGSSSKTRLLLDYLDEPVGYMPIDISRPHLIRASEGLSRDYIGLEVFPVCADYNQPLILPSPGKLPEKTVIFYPGSTIGNFEPHAAAKFLRRIADWCGPGDGLLIGVDLQKPRHLLERAYNDSQGITAAFNRNLLRRANAELGANFRLEEFRHRAVYDEAQGRIEMHLVSQRDQQVLAPPATIGFSKEECIVTEYSYKYRLDTFSDLCSSAGWQVERWWSDKNDWFAVLYLTLH